MTGSGPNTMYRTQCIDNERHAVGIGITISRSACYRMLTRDYSDDQLNWAPFPQKNVYYGPTSPKHRPRCGLFSSVYIGRRVFTRATYM